MESRLAKSFQSELLDQFAEENPEDFAKYEAEFPYKEKLVLPGQLG